jgi:replicative superfamily II helicase
MLDALVVDTWALFDNLAHVVEDSVATSPWRMLRRAPTWNPVWERYLRSLAVSDRPIIQVWPSQRQVLDAGLLSREAPNLTVTMPTSAGKTNIAEWAIVHALARRSGHDEPPLAVYVVPTRALATEVERHLTRTLSPVGIRVSALFGGSEHVLYEMRVIANTDVLVVTSEKFDLLLRNDPTIGERLAIVVADEGHLIGERDRGLRLEMVLSRVRRHTPTARVLVLSAVLPNGDDIARWIEPTAQGKNLADITWTPSTLRVGVFEWQGVQRDGQRGVVRYRADDADHAFFLPNILARRLKRVNYYPGTKTETAAELALHYERLGPVLIAAPTKPTASSAAKKVAVAAGKHGITLGVDASTGTVLPAHGQLREKIVAAVTEFAGGDHELVGLARAGVAYHHSNVPDQVRIAIEDAYRAGALRVVCATSTLGQGVNLPAKTIIISGTQLDQNLKLSVRDFWNTAGRAARPSKETEGHVVLIAKDQNEALQLQRDYVENRELEPAASTIFRLYAGLLSARLGGPPPQGATIPDTIEFDDPSGDAVQWAETTCSC